MTNNTIQPWHEQTVQLFLLMVLKLHYIFSLLTDRDYSQIRKEKKQVYLIEPQRTSSRNSRILKPHTNSNSDTQTHTQTLMMRTLLESGCPNSYTTRSHLRHHRLTCDKYGRAQALEKSRMGYLGSPLLPAAHGCWAPSASSSLSPSSLPVEWKPLSHHIVCKKPVLVCPPQKGWELQLEVEVYCLSWRLLCSLARSLRSNIGELSMYVTIWSLYR